MTLVVLAGILAVRQPTPEAAAASHSVAVLVAAHDLDAGAVLAAGDTIISRWPEPLVPRGALSAEGQVPGQVLTGSVRAGEALTDARVIGPGLAASLPTGTTAAPVRLADPAIAALLRPGDRVDLYAVAAEPGVSTPVPATLVASAALVLAVPATGQEPPGSGGVIVVAVTSRSAAQLIGAANSAALAATLSPP